MIGIIVGMGFSIYGKIEPSNYILFAMLVLIYGEVSKKT